MQGRHAQRQGRLASTYIQAPNIPSAYKQGKITFAMVGESEVR